MSKKIAIGAGVAALLLIVCVGSIFATDWNDYTESDVPENIPVAGVDENDNLDESSLAYALFEQYGPVLLILAVLMFGAMIGGVCIAREESEHDDSN